MSLELNNSTPSPGFQEEQENDDESNDELLRIPSSASALDVAPTTTLLVSSRSIEQDNEANDDEEEEEAYEIKTNEISKTTRLCDVSLLKNNMISIQTSRLIVVLTCGLAHLMFLYGQTAIMWYLFFAVEVDAAIQANSLGAKLAFTALGYTSPMNITLTLNYTIQEFTYWDAIRGLATGHTGPVDPRFHPPDPGAWGKVSALVLILFSAIWPHAKLFMLHLTYWREYKSNEEDSRSNTLYWLDSFGKWSLADVFVICTLLAVCNLDVPLKAETVLEGVRRQVEDLAKELRVSDASTRRVARAICQTVFYPQDVCRFPDLIGRDTDCMDVVDSSCTRCACSLETAFPIASVLLLAAESVLKGTTANGAATAVLRVAGRSGIYMFCTATLVSLYLSYVLDRLDHRVRKNRLLESRSNEQRIATAAIRSARNKLFVDNGRQSFTGRARSWSQLSSNQSSTNRGMIRAGASILTLSSLDDLASLSYPMGIHHDDLESTHHSQHQISDGHREEDYDDREGFPTVKTKKEELSSLGLPLFSMFIFFVSILATFCPTMERRVPGSLTDLIAKDFNITLFRKYSVFELVSLAGVAGGPDYYLMGSFALFTIVGPLLRGFLMVILTWVDCGPKRQKSLAFTVGSLGVVAGWDVLLLALILVSIEMPKITQGIVSPNSVICEILHQMGEPMYCLSIEFYFVPPIAWLLPAACLGLLICGVRIVQLAFFAFDPYEDGYVGSPEIVTRFAQLMWCG